VEMTSHAQRPVIGAVGAKLLYKNNTIRHAGYILGIHGHVGIAHHSLPAKSSGHLCRLQAIQNSSAVSASCMVTRREVFEQAGGLDRMNFPNAYGDIDYCLRLQQEEHGLRIIWTPYAQLYQLGSKKTHSGFRNDGTRREELARFREKWKSLIENDPYYNP